MPVLFFQNKYFPKVKSGYNFDQESAFHHKNGVAFGDNNIFVASGLNEGGNLQFFVPGGRAISLKEWVGKSFGDLQPTESQYVPGTYYKRIWRPLVCQGRINVTAQDALNAALVSLRILVKKLDDLFETIEPAGSNLSVYGHRIREVLLMACMEVESSWSAVLRENNYSSSDMWNTRDYVKLSKPMFLDGYELSLQSYPSVPTFVPFKDWDPNSPTKSLVWYDAYNKTKHDREGNLKFATLDNAIKAVGAAVIMFFAQGGLNIGSPWDQRDSVIRNVFRVTTVGLKRYEKEFYIPKVELRPDIMQPAPAADWIAINYPFLSLLPTASNPSS
jgi:hypothetical protein